VFLPETQQAAEADHQANDDDFGQVAFFAIALRQPVVGDKADNAQGQQYIDEGVVQGQQKLHQGVRWLVVSHLVVAIALQAFGGVLLGQACGGGAYIGQSGRETVLGFPSGTHGQFVIVAGVVLVPNFSVFYGAHDEYSCRQLLTVHMLIYLLRGEPIYAESQTSQSVWLKC